MDKVRDFVGGLTVDETLDCLREVLTWLTGDNDIPDVLQAFGKWAEATDLDDDEILEGMVPSETND